MRGLERVGERRWDLVLDRGQRIMLPVDGPLPALERVIALDKAQDVLGRDVAVVDMRSEGVPRCALVWTHKTPFAAHAVRSNWARTASRSTPRQSRRQRRKRPRKPRRLPRRKTDKIL
ncbi:cell division protein FtsQ/DivIB [Paracoccus cavernae]|uniref:cell division protein FtsQ/DivIB n=1 Tax=Paracoccus cavernae TaxID=1571207 RepID=UPI003631140B